MSSYATGPSSYRDTLGYLAKHVHLRLTARVDAALRPFGIDRREFAVLRALDGSEPLSQQKLAALLGIDPTTMVAVIDTLAAKGIVVRSPDPADRRRNAIGFTPDGRGAYRDANEAFEAAEAAFLAPLEGEAQGFVTALRVVLAADEESRD